MNFPLENKLPELDIAKGWGIKNWDEIERYLLDNSPHFNHAQRLQVFNNISEKEKLRIAVFILYKQNVELLDMEIKRARWQPPEPIILTTEQAKFIMRKPSLWKRLLIKCADWFTLK